MQGSSRIDELRQKFHENPRRYFAPLANEYRKAGDPEQAIAICRAHLAQQPGHMSGHVVYGQALYDARRPDEARTVFEKALTLDPDNAIVVKQLGDIAREKGDTSEARHWYGKALDLDPGDAQVAAYVAELTEPLVGDATDGEVADTPAEEVVAATEPAEEAVVAGKSEEAVEDAPVPVKDLEDEAPDVVEVQADEATVEATPAEPQGDGEDPESGEADEPADREIPLEIETEVVAAESSQQPIEKTEESREPAPLELSDTSAVADVEVPLPEIVQEPVITPEPVIMSEPLIEPETETTPEPVAAPEREDPAWRKTPRPEDSPFVTRTMAELYARQGYRAAALDVYRQLALRHPEDSEIQDRIAELTGERDRAVAAESISPVSQRPSPETVEPPTPEPAADEAPEVTAEPSSESDGEEDLSDEPAFAPSAEDLNLEVAAPAPDTGGLHFTEMEISDSPVNHSIELDSESPFGELSWDLEPVASDGETGLPVEGEAEPARVVAEAPEPAVAEAASAGAQEAEETHQPVEDEAAAAMAEAPVAEAPVAEAPVAEAEPEPAAEPEPEPEPEAEPEAAAVVAYSPEPPKRDDLPHFTPRGPTVREFFAALGAHRPPSADQARGITASAAIPGGGASSTSGDDLPLATDAFSNLFADAPPVSEEDSRAAFALSGAISGTAHNPNPTSLRTSPPLPAPAVPDGPSEETRESEEDIRRFREWLDGLADS